MFNIGKDHLHRFRWMGYTFVGMALFFGIGAYFFPTTPPLWAAKWLYLAEEEKESFYMVSIIFLVAGIYCFNKK